MNRDDPFRWLRENSVDAILCGALIVGVFVFGFGAANWWCDHVSPQFPDKSSFTAEQYERKVDDYPRRVAETGKSAVIPWVYAVPLTFAGGVLALSCLIVLIARNN